MQPGLLKPLGQVLRTAREDAGINQIDIATRAGVDRSVVSRLETGKRWPEKGPDLLVAAYADECGVEWPEFWRRAIDGS